MGYFIGSGRKRPAGQLVADKDNFIPGVGRKGERHLVLYTSRGVDSRNKKQRAPAIKTAKSIGAQSSFLFLDTKGENGGMRNEKGERKREKKGPIYNSHNSQKQGKTHPLADINKIGPFFIFSPGIFSLDDDAL